MVVVAIIVAVGGAASAAASASIVDWIPACAGMTAAEAVDVV